MLYLPKNSIILFLMAFLKAIRKIIMTMVYMLKHVYHDHDD